MDKKKLHIDISSDIKDKLDIMAKERGVTTNQLIRFILAEYLLNGGK